jgi:hypothetical protein
MGELLGESLLGVHHHAGFLFMLCDGHPETPAIAAFET